MRQDGLKVLYLVSILTSADTSATQYIDVFDVMLTQLGNKGPHLTRCAFKFRAKYPKNLRKRENSE